MPNQLILALPALIVGFTMTTIGLVATGPVATFAIGIGAKISFWLYSGRVHEIGYAFWAIASNSLFYSALAYLGIWLYGVAIKKTTETLNKGSTQLCSIQACGLYPNQPQSLSNF